MAWPPSKIALNPALAAKLRAAGHGDMIAKPKRRNAQPEAEFQAEVVRFLEDNLAGKAVMWSATMNGVRLRTPAARRKAHEQGLRPGVLDLVFIPLRGHVSCGVSLWAELKSDTGKPTDAQQMVLDALGRKACLCSTFDELVDFLEAWAIL